MGVTKILYFIFGAHITVYVDKPLRSVNVSYSNSSQERQANKKTISHTRLKS